MRRVVLAFALAGAVVLGSSGPAAADSVAIRKVDTTAFPKVVVSALVTGPTPAVVDFHLRENGRIVRTVDVVPLARTNTPVGVVLVVDTSGSMAQNGKIGAAKDAARQFVSKKLPNDQIAVVAFSSQARLVTDFTTDTARLDKAISDLTPEGETALWDGVRTGLALLADRPDLQPNLLLLSDGKDTVSTSKPEEARAAALTSHAAVFAVGLEGGDFEAGPVKALAESTGGRYLATGEPGTLAGLYDNIQRSLQNQYEIAYTSTAEAGTLDIVLAVAGSRTTASVNAGSISRGASTRPEVVERGGGPAFLHGESGRWVVALLVLTGAGLLTVAAIQLLDRDPSAVEAALSPYTSAPQEGRPAAAADRALAETQLMQRAVDATAKLASGRGLLPRLETLLARASLPLRPAEVLFFNAATAVVFSALALVATGSLLLAAGALVLVALAPLGVLKFLAARRRRRFTSQLPDTLQLLSGSLRAGYSLMQGLEAVAQEVDDPMGAELRRVVPETRLGRLLEDSLEDVGRRMGSPDFDWAVMAVKIQREVGGNLAELLSTVAETMVARERLRREVSALTAEGRISAIILGILPVGIGLALYVMNPEYTGVLFSTTLGQLMLGVSGAIAVFGFWWMKKMIEIEI